MTETIIVITTAPAELHAVKRGDGKSGYKVREAELAWVPQDHGQGRGCKRRPQLLKLLDALEELDDVQKVDANFEMDEDALAEA